MGKLQVKNRGFRVSLIPESLLYAGAMNNEEGEINRGISPRYSGNLDEKSPLSGCIYSRASLLGIKGTESHERHPSPGEYNLGNAVDRSL